MAAIRLKYIKYPKLIETMRNRHISYNATLEYIREKEKLGELFVIRPHSELTVSRVEKDPQKLREAYEIGRRTAEKYLSDIIAYLQK